RFEFFSASARRDIISAKHLAYEILIGLERNEFVPFYQLQFDARTLEGERAGLDLQGAELLAEIGIGEPYGGDVDRYLRDRQPVL
ncbi:hypothetical protein AB9F39_37090, partial [Rhizobium leguminosarum]|uniref:hypothetical protein n=1 Tax=Rhizobium leguminosarum TaxID=384 RepID=UPI003F9DA503